MFLIPAEAESARVAFPFHPLAPPPRRARKGHCAEFKPPLRVPRMTGSTLNAGATDYRAIEYNKLERFNGQTWGFVEQLDFVE